MKKLLLTFSAILCFSHYSNAQSPNGNANANSQWRINGNSASTSDFIGTTNNQDLILKTNNIQRALFDTQGRTIFDGGGEIIIHPGGLNRPILTNPISAYMLKVGGSGHFDGEVNTRQLFVQEYITYLKNLKGPRIDVDTIRMDSTRGIFGHTKIFGDVQIKQNLEVLGNATFKNNVVAEKGFTFDGTNGIKYTPNNSGGGTFSYGKIAAPLSVLSNCAAGPQAWANHQFSGLMQLFDGQNPATTGLLNFQTFGTKSFIDASDGGNTGGGSALLLNYFCGNDVGICNGQYGGNVGICNSASGGVVSMGKNVEIGLPTANLATALNINLQPSINFGLVINNPALTTSNKIVFEVSNTGKTNIGVDRPKVGGYAAAAMLSVDGLILAKEVRVAISTTTHWSDYVFDKNYKLMPLNDVESFIKKNKHLPEVPSAEDVVKDGISVNEISATLLKKTEELTLYTIDLKKQLEAQQKQINSLKK